MADRPILFSAPMVRALLDGRKTQTRRIFKGVEQNENGFWHVHGSGGGVIGVAEADVGTEAVGYLPIQIGDRLYVREHWRTANVLDLIPPRDLLASENETVDYTPVRYEADGATRDFHPLSDPEFGKHRQAMHMPKWASRLTLIVTEVRVERLHDISRGDAMEEGCPFANMASGPNPCDWYSDLWDQINGPGAWEANPWVAAYTFTVIHQNIAEVRDGAA